LVGFGIFGWGLWTAWRSSQASEWPVVEGKLTHVSLDRRSGNKSVTYEVKVEYHYEAEGREYTGTRLAFGYTGSNIKNTHDEIYQKLRKAKKIEVRYDPADPAIATLSHGVHQSVQFLMIFGGTWLLFVIGFSLIWWKMSSPDDVLIRNLVVP
jgi:hypothetical protein